MSSETKFRVAYPPANSDKTKPGAVQRVILKPGETVEWEWTHFPDGKSAVTGYNIIKKG